MPLDYVLGHVSFFGKEFIVNENTLVPRPETEYMVQAVTEHIQSVIANSENEMLVDNQTVIASDSVAIQSKNQTILMDI